MYFFYLHYLTIVVNKLAYDLKIPFTDIVLASWSDPQRGDIVTCWSPADGARLVKRVVGVPGVTDQVVELSGLEPETTYHFAVTAIDLDGTVDATAGSVTVQDDFAAESPVGRWRGSS